METLEKMMLHPIVPGSPIPDDWYNKSIPQNIEVGEQAVTDSVSCFKHFFSKLPVGLRIGDFVTLWRSSLATEENGYIEIGDYSYLSNAAIVCSEKIIIGKRVFLAGGVTIADSDFHPVAPAARVADTIALSPLGNHKHRPPVIALPVIIEDDVWIGYNATVLKGVRVGAGAVISPGALVIKDVAPGDTVAGNPAKSINPAT
jgi:acetyltransferase-like isoleucine patch superfamily enzyme